MSVTGAPAPRPAVGAADVKVAVVASEWHAEVMAGLLAGARRALADAGIVAPHEVRVPGAFELTVAASQLAGAGYDAIVALGVVIRGGTPHFDYVCQSVTAGLTAVAEHTGIPVGFGVLTCDDEKQALDRAGLPGSAEDKGYEAATAAVQTAVTLRPYRGMR
jgi:6,7-dimethyl-8-ribityllumazine synthase